MKVSELIEFLQRQDPEAVVWSVSSPSLDSGIDPLDEPFVNAYGDVVLAELGPNEEWMADSDGNFGLVKIRYRRSSIEVYEIEHKAAYRIKHGDQRVQPMRSDPGMTEEGFQRMVLGDKFYEMGVDDD